MLAAVAWGQQVPVLKETVSSYIGHALPGVRFCKVAAFVCGWSEVSRRQCWSRQ